MIAKITRTFLMVTLTVFLSVPADASDDKKKQKKNSDVENIGNRNINKGSINFSSIEKEMALGRGLAADVEREAKLVDDPTITEYVNRLTQNLVRNSDAQVPFTVKVIDSEEINAFALPGGYLYINTGLIMAADEEAELAGVLAHEIAHVTARHGTENQSKATLINYATIPLIFLGGVGGYAARQVAQFAIPMTFLKFSRKAEEEADYLGIQYMHATGYDPSAMISFFEKIQAREKSKPGSISGLFASHPATEDRLSKTKENIATVLPEKDQYALTTSEFEDVKGLLAALENRIPAVDDRRPSLRRRTPRPDLTEADETVVTESPDDDDRPVMKRKPGER